MKKSHVENIIIKYLNKEATSEEVEVLKELIASKDYIELFKSYLLTDTLIDSEYLSFDVDKALDLVEEKMNVKQAVQLNWVQKNASIFKYAAVICLGLFTASYLYLSSFNDKQEVINEITLTHDDGTIQTIESGINKNILNSEGELLGKQNDAIIVYSNEDKSEITELKYNKLYVPYGKRFQIELADGSEVILNSGSSLKYPVQFSKNSPREVFLDGEAYFKVSKDKLHSFLVHANNINTEVYGTEFNMSSYKEDEREHVVLIEGSVGVYTNHGKDNLKMIRPFEKAELSDVDDKIVVDAVNIEKYIAWKEGVLMFDNEKFEIILKKLERHFDVSIVNNFKKINNNKYTGVFDIESVDEILTAFSNHNAFKFERKNKQITINR